MKSAFDFITMSKQNLDLLNNEYITFLEKLLAHNQQKGEDLGDDEGTEIFSSSILDTQSDIKYNRPDMEERKGDLPQIKTISAERYDLRAILFCPPYLLSTEGLDQLKTHFIFDEEE